MYTERVQKIEQLEAILDRDVYFLCHNRQNQEACIDGTMIDVLRRIIDFSKTRDGAAIIIQTPGGYLDEAYYIGEFFREHYSKVDAYIVSDCYSGGTIIALSADNIYLSPNGCLGPIDIQNHSESSTNSNWYPAVSGQVEALKKAARNKEINSFLRNAFSGKMDVLATYFKEKYTYRELIGENVKKHCIDQKKWGKVWEYMSALNISHGSPLTYRKLVSLGLDVKMMDPEVAKIATKLVRDAEHEFGDLKEKSILYDYYSNYENTAKVSVDKSKATSNPLSSNKLFDYEVEVSNVHQCLAVIETLPVGFIQRREIAITLHDSIPACMAETWKGWEEENNDSLVSDVQKEKLDVLLNWCVATSMERLGIDPDTISDEAYNKLLDDAFSQLYDVACQKLTMFGEELDNYSGAVLYKTVVDQILSNTFAVFDEGIEKLLKKYAHDHDSDYDSMDFAEKLQLHDLFISQKGQEMIKEIGFSAEDMSALSETEISKLILEYAFEQLEKV